MPKELHVYLNARLAKRLAAFVKKTGLKYAEVARQALDEYLKNRGF